MAVGLCIGHAGLVGRRKAVNSNMQDVFCSTLYSLVASAADAALSCLEFQASTNLRTLHSFFPLAPHARLQPAGASWRGLQNILFPERKIE